MSDSQLWDDVDDYFTSRLAPDDEALRAARRENDAAGLPHIAVTAAQGKLLQLLAQVQGARHYVEWALRLTRTGSLIVLDNVVRGGRVTDADSTEPDIVGTRAAIELMATHPRLSGTAIQTVGAKGYDGFALARVLD